MKSRFLILLLLIATIGPVSFTSAKTPAQKTRILTVDHGAQDPTVSLDGAQIAASVFGKIWVMFIAGGEARQISEGLGWDTHPAWSPDGRFIAYAHQLPSGTDLVVRNLLTGGSNTLYHTEAAIGQIAFHPKGGEIFFLLERSQYDSHLYRIQTNGGEAKQITHTENWHEWSFALSPDGKEVLLDSGKYGGSDLYRIRLDGMQVTRITRTPAHEFSVGWSCDGNTWAYIRTDNGIDSVIAQQAKGGPARTVFSSPYDQKQLALLADGQSAVMCAGRRLYRLNFVSGEVMPISFTARFVLPEQSKADLVIVNARMIDPGTNRAVPNATIEIRGGRIAAVRSGQAATGTAADIPVIDAAGRCVMPGLMDNHYHYWTAFDGSSLLARGITTIRDPGVAMSTSMNFKEAIAFGLIAGPTIYTCGPLIDGLDGYHPYVDVELSKPEAAAALVRALKAQGADALKVYFMLSPEVLRAVIKEARAQGLPVTGHIGVRTGWREAMEAGISGFNHIRVWRDFLPLDNQPQGENESLDASRNLMARMQANWSDIDPDGPGVEALIKTMVEKHIGFDPTLAIQRISDSDRKRFGLEQFTVVKDSYRRMARFVARAERMGVLLLAGTDNESLFDELESYADAGVPSMAILKAATINGAAWLGKKNEYGTIEPGKRADLIIVDGDPTKEIKDLRRTYMVIKDGRIAFKK
ncbi:MAG TPA: amidohydrolase family protein [Blastocatellia bacterium]|nr:amidohydrolase family protein [Blastocatellia bacterium]